MLIENADEPYAEEISGAVISARKKGADISTTTQLRDRSLKMRLALLRLMTGKRPLKKSCQRTFQALRIDVNSEYEVLYEFLEKLPDALAKGGRVAILTFHSGKTGS